MILITIPDARLCADPRVNEVASGKVANIRVASNYRTKVDGEWTSEALFFDVALWRSAEAVEEYFHKGSPIIVWGELQERTWTDKDGGERRNLEIGNAQWTFPPKNDGQAEAAAPKQKAKAAVSKGDFDADSDIPF
jgi:single-strand DNA-binding protein